MRILIVNHHPIIVGGVERYLQRLMPLLLNQGHSLAFVYGYFADGRPCLHPPEVTSWCAHGRSVSALMAALAAWRPDVVYVHSIDDRELEELLLSTFPCVLFVHDHERTCPTGRKCYARPSLSPCHLPAGPRCLLLHYLHRCGGLNPVTALRSYQRQSQLLAIAHRYRTVLTASAFMQAELMQNGLSNVQVCPLPLTLEPRAPPSPRRAPHHVVMVSRLVDVKGGRLLIPALHEAGRRLQRPLRLTVAGAGPDEAPMRAAAASLNQAINFVGWLEPDATLDLLGSADLLALPSVWPEPFGLSGLEAASCAVPSVAFDIGGIRDWMLPGVSGELANAAPPTADGLAAAIVRALASDEHYQHLRIGALEQAQQFTTAAHTARLQALLAGVAA